MKWWRDTLRKGLKVAYKDAERQKQANREAAKRYRQGMTPKGMTQPDTVIPDSIKGLTPDQLYDAIYSYPADTWVDSPEYQELLNRLHIKTVDELEDEGY